MKPKAQENLARKIYNVSDLQVLFDLSESSVRKAIKAGKGPPYVRIGRRQLFPIASFDRWLEERAKTGEGV